MGYCYSHDGLLLCDCCQAIAACRTCRKKHHKKFQKAHHRDLGCERGHQESEREQREREEFLRAGRALRISAMSVDDPKGMVHVLFKSADGTTEGWYMSEAVYGALGLSQNTSPDDYREHGELTPAPPSFFFGGGAPGTTKQGIPMA